MPCLAPENKPGSDIRFLLFYRFQDSYKIIPLPGYFQSHFIQHFLIVEKAGHGHIGTYSVLVSCFHIRTGFLHGWGKTIPPLRLPGKIQVLAFIHKPLFIGGHDIRHLS